MSWPKILSKQYILSMLFVGYVVIFLSVSHELVACISSAVWVKPCMKKNDMISHCYFFCGPNLGALSSLV